MKEKIKEEAIRLSLCLGLPVVYEILFQLIILKNGIGTLPMLCHDALVGGVIWLLTGWFGQRAGKILYGVLNGLLCLYFIIQLVYFYVFQVYFSFTSLFAVGGDIMQFKDQMFHAILANLGNILWYLAIFAGALFLFIRFRRIRRYSWKLQLLAVTGAALLLVLFQASLLVGGTGDSSAYSLYKKSWTPVLGAQKLGILVVAEKDIVSMITGETAGDELGDLIIIERPLPTVVTPMPTKQEEAAKEQPDDAENPEGTQGQNSANQTDTSGTLEEPEVQTPTEAVTDTPTPSPIPTVSPTPTPTPIDTSPNVLDIDFSALAEAEEKEEIKTLHEYFASEEYTLKNEYTGLFEGYNLILITAEGFAPYAMQDGLTPTLQRLAKEGFVFENYYAPLWFTSTIDGEFANTTGLIPDSTHSLRRMIGHDMRFTFGNMLGELGYLTNAYHNHSYTYYKRHKIYPTMGYTYKGRGNGLEIKEQWPGSDLEMMELTLPEYIDKEPFHVYYMTVSGHMEYNWGGNAMSRKHREVVSELPYSEAAKAYIACNYELELALAYLVEQLEAAGIADRTVIALATDHYPYGLENETISELLGHEVEEKFELYKSTLILWSASMKEPVPVKKFCSAIDIAPTLANLFGLKYDSRLYMGKDILSTSEGLVVFSDKSFITDRMMYNASNGRVTRLTEEELPEGYEATMKQIVKNRFKVSKGIIDKDYYRYLPKQE